MKGGTSTDVSRYSGTFEHSFETETAGKVSQNAKILTVECMHSDNTTPGVFIQAPQLAIETVAAGGGSRLFFQSGLFQVGPESAGAHPGPVCYRKNGYLAITDANVMLGRILREFFPKIFGPNEDQPLGKELVEEEFRKLTDVINKFFESQYEKLKSEVRIALISNL